MKLTLSIETLQDKLRKLESEVIKWEMLKEIKISNNIEAEISELKLSIEILKKYESKQ